MASRAIGRDEEHFTRSSRRFHSQPTNFLGKDAALTTDERQIAHFTAGGPMPQSMILIADPDPDSRGISATILQHAGYRALEVADGNSLLEAALAHRPAGIVMELGLPGVDGYAAIALMRRLGRTAGIPILVLTTPTAMADRGRAEQLGCDAYLSKPYSHRWLLVEVQWLLCHARERSGSHRCASGEEPDMKETAAERAPLRERANRPAGSPTCP